LARELVREWRIEDAEAYMAASLRDFKKPLSYTIGVIGLNNPLIGLRFTPSQWPCLPV